MKNLLNQSLSAKQFFYLELAVIVAFAVFPLFFNFPYRVNIFLSWEGAYRMYLGQVPYKDFGLPMGFAYWLIPTLFFHIFGPYMSSLIKAQVLINIVSGISFRGLLNVFDVQPAKRFLTVVVFCLSYSFFNFWPWYNHTVVVFEIIGLFFVLYFLLKSTGKWRYLHLFFGAFFTFLSFFTKQDGGGLAFMLCLALVTYYSIAEKKWQYPVYYLLFFAVTAAAFFLPFMGHDITYWFNVGQEPHYSRFSLADIVDAVFGESRWIKFYIMTGVFIMLSRIPNFQAFLYEKRQMLFFLFTMGIMVQAFIIQVTSYTPPNNNIYFHSFAFAFIIANVNFNIRFNRIWVFAIGIVMIFFWWSGVYWKYVDRIVKRYLPQIEKEQDPSEVVSINTYVESQKDTSFTNIGMSEWKLSGMKAFENVYMPEPAIKGMERIKEMDVIKNNDDPEVLNMSELTPLAYELGYDYPSGQPLWYHQNVSIFDREIAQICDNIKNDKYDLVLFEVIPNLNNFYPETIRTCLKTHYRQTDKFIAPRRPTNAWIEVYVRQ